MKALNPRQQAFLTHHLGGCSAAEAYRRAGYKCGTAAATEAGASKLLRNAKVQAALAAAAERAGVDAAAVVRGLHAEATSYGKGSSHAARVSAWVALGKHLGMFKDKVEVAGDPAAPVRHDHGGSVFDRIDRLAALFAEREGAGDGEEPARPRAEAPPARPPDPGGP